MSLRRFRQVIVIAVVAAESVFSATTPEREHPRAWWVWFVDKGPEQRADDDSAPVFPAYLARVHGIAPVRTTTRWFNGASVLASEEQLAAIMELPFVRGVAPVLPLRGERPLPVDGLLAAERPARSGALDYGLSLTQNRMIGADSLHALGLNGQGVLIAVLDEEFPYLTHPAFQNLQIAARRDFIDGDTLIVGYSQHGSQVLSCLGAYQPGALIGPAYGARFALARTEFGPTETRSEEDYWLRAAEWADSLGARVISSSVGYNYFHDPNLPYDPATDYSLSELDGKTSLITRAAQKAAGKGIVVVNCAGNERGTPSYWNGKLLMPADGDSVIAVGAVTSAGTVTSFSSFGPTADGRIKPDIVALGSSVRMISESTGYTWASGTSYSTPLIAGVVAQLLQAHPGWDPIAVRTALRLSGSHALEPDTTRGWGLANAVKALAADSAVFGKVTGDLSGGAMNQTFVNVLDTAGIVVRSGLVSPLGWFLYEKLQPGTYRVRAEHATLSMSAETTLVLPMLPRETHLVLKPSVRVENVPHPGAFWVGQPFPNPGNPGTRIAFRVPSGSASGYLGARVFSVNGQVVREMHVPISGTNGVFAWDGSDSSGRPVASGVYVVRLSFQGVTTARRVVIAR